MPYLAFTFKFNQQFQNNELKLLAITDHLTSENSWYVCVDDNIIENIIDDTTAYFINHLIKDNNIYTFDHLEKNNLDPNNYYNINYCVMNFLKSIDSDSSDSDFDSDSD